MRALHRVSLVLGALLGSGGAHALHGQDLLTYAFNFSARAAIFGDLQTRDFTWSATRPTDATFCQSPNSITSCWHAVTNSTLTISGLGTYSVSNPFRLRSRSYGNNNVGSIAIEWAGGNDLLEVWNAQLLGHDLAGPLSPLVMAGDCPGLTGVPQSPCFRQPPLLANLALATSGGEVRLTTILQASYSAALVPGGTDPETGAPLPPVDPDPDGEIPPELDCRITPANCVPPVDVPEPGSLLLLLLGMGLLAGHGRRAAMAIASIDGRQRVPDEEGTHGSSRAA